MLLFIGSERKGYFIEDVLKILDIPFSYIPENNYIEKQEELILQTACKFMVFDITQYADEVEVITREIRKILECNNAKVIIFAPGYSASNSIINSLIRAGFQYFIFGVNLSKQKEQLEKCLNGYYDLHGNECIDFFIPKQEEELSKEHYNFKNVGVAGSNARIGTTTVALQIVKYLKYNGYSACYIQMNSHRYLEELFEWYKDNCKHDEELGKITYESVDMFYRLEKIPEILKQGYDYYVFDYGVYSDTNFNTCSFLEKDHQLLVCGSAPNELNFALRLIDSMYYDHASYIFNLTPEGEQKDLLELMDSKANKTYFTGYIPDPFSYNPVNSILGDVIPVDNRNEDLSIKKKKKFFFGKRK